jgi:uncharacterized protein YjdB
MKAKIIRNFLAYPIAILLLGLLSACSKEEDEIKVDDIMLDTTELIITVGESKTIQYTILPAEANVDVIWSSDNTLIAIVDDYGKVTGVKIGETNIKATVGDKTVTCKVKVVPEQVHVESISLNVNEISVTEDFVLTATIYPENASNKTIIWTSSNEEVAIVDQEGNVTILSAGETIITATSEDGEKKATCRVIVEPSNVTGVVLDVENLYLILNETATLQATIIPAHASNKNMTWSSDNPNVATVDNTGKVTAVSVGDATITVKTEDGDMTDTCKISVSNAIFSDNFNRGNTGKQGPDNPQGIGSDWTIISGIHEINDQTLKMSASDQSVILYTAENAITKNVDGNFRISTDISHASWAGLIFNAKVNAQSSYSYYVFRVQPATNEFQFLATENNGAGWAVLQIEVIQAASFPKFETYRIAIQSIEIGKFTAIITDSNGKKIGEYQLIDNENKNFQDGYSGYWGQMDPTFDNFLLEVR